LGKLSEFSENARWIRENYEKLKRSFRDEWVAVYGRRVVDYDKDLARLVERLRRSYGKDYGKIAIEFIASKEIELVLEG